MVCAKSTRLQLRRMRGKRKKSEPPSRTALIARNFLYKKNQCFPRLVFEGAWPKPLPTPPEERPKGSARAAFSAGICRLPPSKWRLAPRVLRWMRFPPRWRSWSARQRKSKIEDGSRYWLPSLVHVRILLFAFPAQYVLISPSSKTVSFPSSKMKYMSSFTTKSDVILALRKIESGFLSVVSMPKAAMLDSSKKLVINV